MNLPRAVLPRLPREVEGIERNAVTAPAGPRIEAHESEGLRRRGVEHFPDVDAHAVEDHLELVHERDVDGAEDVLDQLAASAARAYETRTVFEIT